jgi:hypothetical protein
VSAWTSSATPRPPSSSAAQQADALRRRGWSVGVVSPRDHLASAWQNLANGSNENKRDFTVPSFAGQKGPAA